MPRKRDQPSCGSTPSTGRAQPDAGCIRVVLRTRSSARTTRTKRERTGQNPASKRVSPTCPQPNNDRCHTSYPLLEKYADRPSAIYDPLTLPPIEHTVANDTPPHPLETLSIATAVDERTTQGISLHFDFPVLPCDIPPSQLGVATPWRDPCC